MSQGEPNTKAGTRPANKRGVSRLMAVQALYQMDISSQGLMETVTEYEATRLGQEVDGEQYLEADPAWFRSIVSGVVKHQKEIDPQIQSSLTNDWPLSRIDTLLRQVLRAGVFELHYKKDVPSRVIISEYVDVAKAFYEDDEPKMVNGVLDRVAKAERPSEFNGK